MCSSSCSEKRWGLGVGVAEETALSELDKKIVQALQGDFPLVAEPYKALAESIGISEELFLERVRAMEAEKKIRKMGAVLRHREVGFQANVLVVWRVPEDRLDEMPALRFPIATTAIPRRAGPTISIRWCMGAAARSVSNWRRSWAGSAVSASG